MIACALIANAASFILPISNPANLVIFNSHMPPLITWLEMFWMPSVFSVITTLECLLVIFSKSLSQIISEQPPQEKLTSGGKLAVGGLLFAVASLVTASALSWPLGASTAATAFAVVVSFAFRDRSILMGVVKGVSWSVIPLVAGLFVLVESLKESGLLQICKQGLRIAEGLDPISGHLVTAFGIGLISNVVNNLPAGLISGAAAQAAHIKSGLESSLLIGVDLGPNLSDTGSLGTILWLQALRRAHIEITFWQFLRVGLIVMPLSLLGAILALGFTK